jgi:hypothetical protein
VEVNSTSEVDKPSDLHERTKTLSEVKPPLTVACPERVEVPFVTAAQLAEWLAWNDYYAQQGEQDYHRTLVVDVRTPLERADGHVKGSVSVPYCVDEESIIDTIHSYVRNAEKTTIVFKQYLRCPRPIP